MTVLPSEIDVHRDYTVSGATPAESLWAHRKDSGSQALGTISMAGPPLQGSAMDSCRT